jgi:hypothetical protein
MRRRRIAIATGIALLALGVSAGGALAHGGMGGDRGTAKTCDERLAAQAKAKGVTVEKLVADRRAKAAEWVDKMLEKKRISAERAAELKQKIAAWNGCGPTLGGMHGRGNDHRAGRGARGGSLFGVSDAVLSYLGLTVEQLRAELRKGQSLAEIATAKGKSVDGLKAALTNELKGRLDTWLADKKLSKERYDKAVAALPKLVDRIVSFKPGARGEGAKSKDKDKNKGAAPAPSSGSSS